VKPELLDLICCPRCQSHFELTAGEGLGDEIETGSLACGGCGCVVPIRSFIPRFVETDEYADAFAIEWSAFRTAHLDSLTGLGYLDRQFREFLDFEPEVLAGKLVLDAGCGLGRFSEVVLNYGGSMVAVDLSGAIDVAFENLNSRGNIHFLQADIFNLPFRAETFDFVYSWGVLHHTPDPPRAFHGLPPLVRPGGKLMTMVYANYNKKMSQSHA
jgi:2-polyprenyl-3-methyl-5-hydroxy-6-metoxy-1,4-benzoquinol methylase